MTSAFHFSSILPHELRLAFHQKNYPSNGVISIRYIPKQANLIETSVVTAADLLPLIDLRVLIASAANY